MYQQRDVRIQSQTKEQPLVYKQLLNSLRPFEWKEGNGEERL